MRKLSLVAGVALLVAVCVVWTSRESPGQRCVLRGGDPRTVIHSLPYTISECGSYILAGCLTGVSGLDGITIEADDVTLDLNGFALIGVTGSGDGIKVSAGQRFNVSVRNGTVRDWGGSGVDGANARNSRFEALTLFGNGGDGLDAGLVAAISSCNARENGGYGMVFSVSSVVECTATANGGSGFSIGARTSISGCVAHDNDFHGIEANQDCLILSNVCTCNGQSGSNTGAGIFVIANGARNRIEGNTMAENDWGVRTGTDGGGSVVIGNTAADSLTANFSVQAGDMVGDILVFTAGGTVTSSNPWANFEH